MQRRRTWLIWIFVAAAAAAVPVDSQAAGDTLRVGPNRTYTKIQDAIDDASEGDTIIVDQGTYAECLEIGGKDIVLKSTDPSSDTVRDSTIIAPLASVWNSVAIQMDGTETDACRIEGFTIRNADLYAVSGGSLHAEAVIFRCRIENSGGGVEEFAGLIDDCIIRNNTSYDVTSGGYGAGVNGTPDCIVRDSVLEDNYAENDGGATFGCGTIEGCVIRNNEAGRDAGANSGTSLATETITIYSNLITGNVAGRWGGAIANVGSGSLIDLNTIQDNSAQRGGALWNCDCTIEDNTMESNQASQHGGAFADCDGTIQRNTIALNKAGGDGGAIYDCRGLITRNRIRKNESTGRGAGIALCSGSGSTISNNLIYDNFAFDHGGGIWNCDTIIVHNTIVKNHSKRKGGGNRDSGGSAARDRNNIYWKNTAKKGGNNRSNCKTPSYCCINGYSGSGNKIRTGNPQFGNITATDSRNWDLTLGTGSSCIDKGKNNDSSTDFTGASRPYNFVGIGDGDGQSADIGAYEKQP